MGMLVANPVGIQTPGNVLNELRGAHELIDVERTQAMDMRRKKEEGSWLDGSTLTPSMWSVVSQIKKRSVEQGCGERRVASSLVSTDFSAGEVPGLMYGMSGAFSSSEDNVSETDVSVEECSGLDGVQWSHPLSSEECYGEATGVGSLPYTKLVNLQDLDLMDTITREDIVEVIKPIYERRRCVSIDKFLRGPREGRRSFQSYTGVLFQDKVVEMEQWPASQRTGDLEAALQVPDATTHKRTRQQSLNPSFLRLYALETGMKKKNILPDLNVDEMILEKLSCHEISRLNIPMDSSNGITAEQIKLALITRKKLWSEMCRITRTDLHGEHAPSNLKFVRLNDDNKTDTRRLSKKSSLENSTSSKNSVAAQSSFSAATSLVRVNSEVKPWSQPQMTQPMMFKPCGKISLGKCMNSGELQYVVKGWCDYRFA